MNKVQKTTFPFTITINNPTPYSIKLDYSFHEIKEREVGLKLQELQDTISSFPKGLLLLNDLFHHYLINPLTSFGLKILRKPYFYLYLPAMADHDDKKTIHLFPYGLFQASWQYLMWERLSDTRSHSEKLETLKEHIRYYTAFSIAHEIRHLEQPEHIKKAQKRRNNFTRYVIVPIVSVLMLKILFVDITIKHDWLTLLVVLLGIFFGIIFMALTVFLFYNRLFPREVDANKFAEKEVGKWLERVDVKLIL